MMIKFKQQANQCVEVESFNSK